MEYKNHDLTVRKKCFKFMHHFHSLLNDVYARHFSLHLPIKAAPLGHNQVVMATNWLIAFTKPQSIAFMNILLSS